MACTRVADMAFTEGGRARSRRVSRVDCVEIGAAPWHPHMQPSSPVNVSNHPSYVGRRPPRKISGRESSSWPRMGVSCHLHALDSGCEEASLGRRHAAASAPPPRWAGCRSWLGQPRRLRPRQGSLGTMATAGRKRHFDAKMAHPLPTRSSTLTARRIVL